MIHIPGRRRVVVTGMGCVTPLGSTVERFWRGLAEGVSGVGPITLFDASAFPVRIAAEIKDLDETRLAQTWIDWTEYSRQARFAVAAALQASDMANLESVRTDPSRRGVYFGCGETFPNLATIGALIGNGACQGGARESEKRYEPSSAAALVADLVEAQGPSFNCIAACASSNQAIGEATEIIRRGEAEMMLAGGAHSMIHDTGVSGFYRLSALSGRNDDPTRASRPFDRDRDGFVVGEGAAVLVLEELGHARRRGAEILGEVSGYGSAQDAYRVTDPHPSGRGAAEAIGRALMDARLSVEDIHYINAHGTSTVANDKMETLAIKQAFGSAASRVAISSTKSMTGHLTTAGGALETLACLLAVGRGVVPPTINYETRDPECDLDYVPNAAREMSCEHALNNSFGFGGHNVSLVISRYDESA